MEILQTLGIIMLGAFAVRLAILAYRLWRGDPVEYEQNRLRTGGSFWATLRGEIPTVFDGTRDYRVAAGIAVNRETNEWVEQGRLSSDAISAVLRHRTH